MPFKKRKLGLVLGGGGARGYAHIGILKLLDELKIKPDFIAGTSMGAVIGAMYALGMTGKEIEEKSEELKIYKYIDFSISRKGLIKGDKIFKLFKKLYNNKNFEDTKIPIYINAVDIDSGQEIIFSEGDLSLAVRASMSLPGIVKPIKVNDHVLVDGGVRNNIPIDIIKEKCDVIISSDVMNTKLPKQKMIKKPKYKPNSKVPSLVSAILKSVLILQYSKENINYIRDNSDIYISPDLKGITMADFNKKDIIISKGDKEAKKHIKDIKKDCKRKLF